jgi:hypothetical protein
MRIALRSAESQVRIGGLAKAGSLFIPIDVGERCDLLRRSASKGLTRTEMRGFCGAEPVAEPAIRTLALARISSRVEPSMIVRNSAHKPIRRPLSR